MNKLKLCPFCGSSAIDDEEQVDGYVMAAASAWCGNGDCWVSDSRPTVESWNHRPIEDRLAAENEKLRGSVRTIRDAWITTREFIVFYKGEKTDPVKAIDAALKEVQDDA